MNDSFEFTLHSPLTKEDWNKIVDAEYEHTNFVTFHTPQGKQVKYIKCEVLDKIRAEVADIYCGQYCENPYTAASVRKMALDIIDKYRAESEDEDVEYQRQIEQLEHDILYEPTFNPEDGSM